MFIYFLSYNCCLVENSVIFLVIPSLNSIVLLIIAILRLILEIYIMFKEKECDSMKMSNLTYLKTFVNIRNDWLMSSSGEVWYGLKDGWKATWR